MMTSTELFETWINVLTLMKSYEDVSGMQMDAFFSRVHPQATSEGFLIATAETNFIKEQVEKRYSNAMKRALKELTGMDYLIEIEVDESFIASAAQVRPQSSGDAIPSHTEQTPPSPASQLIPPQRVPIPKSANHRSIEIDRSLRIIWRHPPIPLA